MIRGLPDRMMSAPTREQTAKVHSILIVALQRLADILLQPMTLLAAIIWLLNGSYTDIALIAVVASASLALGSVVMPFILSQVQDIRVVLLGANMVRAAAAALIAIAGWRATSLQPGDLVALLIIAVIIYQVGSAVDIGSNPRAARAVTHEPATSFAWQAIGALAGILGGLVAFRTLSNDGLPFPGAFGWLLVLGGIASVAAVWFQMTRPARRRDLVSTQHPLVSREDVRTLLDVSAMRRFLTFRLILGFAALADPFLIVWGINEMSLGPKYIGAIVLAMALAQAGGGVIWTAFRRARGSQLSLQIATILRLWAIVLAITVPFMARSDWYSNTFDSPAGGSWAFVFVFVLIGLAQSTYLRNEQLYAIRIAGDDALRSAALLLTNLTLVVTAVSALIGAWIIRGSSMETALIVAAALSFIALIASGVLAGRRRRYHRLQPELRGPRKPIRKRRRRRLIGRRRRT